MWGFDGGRGEGAGGSGSGDGGGGLNCPMSNFNQRK